MAEKVLHRIGGTQGHGTFEVVDVSGTVELRLNGSLLATGFSQQSAIAGLTDNTGGSGGSALGAVGDTSGSDESGVINDNFASLNDKIDAIIAALEGAGVIED